MKIIINERQLDYLNESFNAQPIGWEYLLQYEGENTDDYITKIYLILSTKSRKWIIREELFKKNSSDRSEVIFNKVISIKKISRDDIIQKVQDYAIHRNSNHELIKIN